MNQEQLVLLLLFSAIFFRIGCARDACFGENFDKFNGQRHMERANDNLKFDADVFHKTQLSLHMLVKRLFNKYLAEFRPRQFENYQADFLIVGILNLLDDHKEVKIGAYKTSWDGAFWRVVC